jgi:hypothetical protein
MCEVGVVGRRFDHCCDIGIEGGVWGSESEKGARPWSIGRLHYRRK